MIVRSSFASRVVRCEDLEACENSLSLSNAPHYIMFEGERSENLRKKAIRQGEHSPKLGEARENQGEGYLQ